MLPGEDLGAMAPHAVLVPHDEAILLAAARVHVVVAAEIRVMGGVIPEMVVAIHGPRTPVAGFAEVPLAVVAAAATKGAGAETTFRKSQLEQSDLGGGVWHSTEPLALRSANASSNKSQKSDSAPKNAASLPNGRPAVTR